ncbi:MAG: hypothetical protein ACTSXX_12710 [Candidatus Baldrarchaeia archaeon]
MRVGGQKRKFYGPDMDSLIKCVLEVLEGKLSPVVFPEKLHNLGFSRANISTG